ncbi:hypothetical protein NPIL_233011, partial [Nephila pilipes]
MVLKPTRKDWCFLQWLKQFMAVTNGDETSEGGEESMGKQNPPLSGSGDE